MVVFPNAKINLGLEVLRKRKDGFHDIDSVFFPIPLCDAMELMPDKQLKKDVWHFSGLHISGRPTDNLCSGALKLLREKFDVPKLTIFLHKVIPMGAGLGGGSSDGSFVIRALNKKCQLNMSDEEMKEMALQLGSDCPFFINNEPAQATGRGEVLRPVDPGLQGKYLVLIHSEIHVSTAEAYAKMEVDESHESPAQIVKKPIEEWRHLLRNRFEEYAFVEYPELARTKEKLYQSGALYASMTGSGSAIYGIFDRKVERQRFSEFDFVYVAQL